jgi:hypothetical protein
LISPDACVIPSAQVSCVATTGGILAQLPEAELELVKRLVPDDVASPADLVALTAARAEYQRGEAVPDSAINWG